MKSFYKRIIAGACAIVTLFLSCVPSSAAGIGIGFDLSPTDLWSWLNDIGYHTGNFWGSFIDKDLCPQSSNPGGRHNFIEQRTTVDGKTGVYYICEYCGKSAGEVGNTAYQEQVSTLPATGYNSAGVLSWNIPFVSCEPGKCVTISSSSLGLSLDATYTCTESGLTYDTYLYCYVEDFTAPITGTYFFDVSVAYNESCAVFSNGGPILFTSSHGSFLVPFDAVSTPIETSREFTGGTKLLDRIQVIIAAIPEP